MESVATFEEIISSRIYKFTVGPNKREFSIHSALVSAQSVAFDRFVNSAFKEAADFHAKLESVSEETFVLFAQYAYTGSYKLVGIESKPPVKMELDTSRPEPAKPEPVPEPVPEQEDDPWAAFSSMPKKKKKVVTPENALWKEFTNACSTAIQPVTRPGAVSHNGNILLSHARLYVFADCYDMPRLADMSFDKLGLALLKLDVTPEAVTHIIELLRYAYDEPAPEKLQNHLALYATCKASVLWADKKFRELVATHSDLAVAILGIMIEGRVTS
ncbi:hypothetical protein QBC47DRAFT_380525 [Echria macrotheca]|uniref:BTB domain-containing protein n=1 Tax=Echria macrotheca TaxID=438768 RepID=A0AAJ0BGK7_9PEZI|nr:hypothetical protein QBC47DRAFT_380525 [Echria macrotheca]